MKKIKLSFYGKSTSQYRRYTRSAAGNVFYFLFLFVSGMFSVLPLIYCLCTAFKPIDELLVFPPRFFVIRPTLENFAVLPGLIAKLRVPISRYLFNSIFISVVTTVLYVTVASMMAFTLSKSKLRWCNAVFMVIQFALLYSTYTLSIPQYVINSHLGLIDTFWIYILPHIPTAMGAFLMKQYMDNGIPEALIEAAKIDGSSIYRIFWRIAMPLCKPAWMTLTLFCFRDMWSVIPNGTIFSEELKTLPYVLSSISSGGLARSGSAMAATVIMMIPPILVYAVTQSNVMETMSNTGIKD